MTQQTQDKEALAVAGKKAGLTVFTDVLIGLLTLTYTAFRPSVAELDRAINDAKGGFATTVAGAVLDAAKINPDNAELQAAAAKIEAHVKERLQARGWPTDA